MSDYVKKEMTTEIREKLLEMIEIDRKLKSDRMRFTSSLNEYKVFNSVEPSNAKNFNALLMYLLYLSYSANAYFGETLVKSGDNEEYIAPTIWSELNKSAEDGLLCQYTSLIGKIVGDVLFGFGRTEMVQGFVYFEFGSFVSSLIPQLDTNYHSFFLLDGQLVDPLVHQFDYMLHDFKVPFVVGDIPPVITYVGCEESMESIFKILKQHTSVKDIEEWIEMHINCMNSLISNGELDKLSKKVIGFVKENN